MVTKDYSISVETPHFVVPSANRIPVNHYPAEMLAALHTALKKGGRLAICEYYKRVGAMGDPTSDRAVKHIRLDEAEAIREIEANGFKLVKSAEFNPKSQYLAIFEKK